MQLKKLTLLLNLLIVVILATNPLLAADEKNKAWETRLKSHFFQDKTITLDDSVITFTAPRRAEDGAMVPIRITGKLPQTPESHIKELWLIIDNNPSPLAGHFTLSEKSGKADMELRIRVDAYSPVRIVAKTNDGKLHMAERFVKASGGCSAPMGTDMESALKRLGKIRMKTKLSESLLNPVATTLAVSHPNITGLQKDQITTLFIPPHYVKAVKVDFEGETVFSAETDISISENPNFRFYFVPGREGILTATITDTAGNVFTSEQAIKSNAH